LDILKKFAPAIWTTKIWRNAYADGNSWGNLTVGQDYSKYITHFNNVYDAYPVGVLTAAVTVPSAKDYVSYEVLSLATQHLFLLICSLH
jgi:hypothetical protein